MRCGFVDWATFVYKTEPKGSIRRGFHVRAVVFAVVIRAQYQSPAAIV